MDTPITTEAERDKRNFKGLLTGLKQFIDSQLALKIIPHNAIVMYEPKLEKYKRLFGQKSELEQVAADWGGEVIN